jgi:hypothetical protein
MPYIHRQDVVRIVRSCIEARETLGSYEVFLASQEGAVTHKELFAAIRRGIWGNTAPKAIAIPAWAAKLGLLSKRTIGRIVGCMPFERPWMLQYVDRPWVVDTTYTRNRLGWSCAEGMGILERLPVLLDHFSRQHPTWEARNRARNWGQYSYHE